MKKAPAPKILSPVDEYIQAIASGRILPPGGAVPAGYSSRAGTPRSETWRSGNRKSHGQRKGL